MIFRCCIAGCVLLPVIAAAGGKDIKVNKDAVQVGPLDPQGVVAISGPPGSVFGAHPIGIMAQDKKTKLSAGGAVMPDGSFLIQIHASPKDSIKLTFVGADGKKKDIKVKVPRVPLPLPVPPLSQEIRTDTVTVPVGEPAPRENPLPAPPQNDSEIISGEKGLSDSGVIE